MAPRDGSDKPSTTSSGDDPYQSRSGQIEAVIIAWQAISFATIVLRIFARIWTKIALGLDDVLIYIAAALVWGYDSSMLLQVVRYGLGRHLSVVSHYQIDHFQIVAYAQNIIWPAALTFSKLSLLAFYRRVFWTTKAKWPLIILTSLNIMWMIASVLVGIFPCQPLSAEFNPSLRHQGCIRLFAFYIACEAITMMLDLAVLLMPIYFIAQLQKSIEWKFNISLTFLLGLAATIVSALRLWRLAKTLQSGKAADQTYALVDASLWGVIELNLWILVASIPALRPLFHLFVRSKAGTTNELRIGAMPVEDANAGNHLPDAGVFSSPAMGSEDKIRI